MSNSSSNSAPQIDFKTDWNNLDPFNDLGAVAKVDNPRRMLDQFSNGLRGGAEKTVGRKEMIDARLISLLAKHSRAVCRVSVPAGEVDFRGQMANGGWHGTGFLVAPNILLTNHHVLNDETVASKAVAEFDYRTSEADLLGGPPNSTPSAVHFKMTPERLFITSSFEDFDYTFVWIESAAAEQFGTIQMTRGSFLIRQTEPTFILHHPNGHPQKASVDDTELLSVNSSFLLYAADTEGGSSGAPVFNKHGQLAGLHHAWWPIQSLRAKFPNLTGRLNDGNITGHANEGIKLAAMAIDLERRIAMGDTKARDAGTVLQAFDGSDTLTGMFGSLGRHSGETTAPAYEKVVTVYQGREQDIDVGAWNIEWLNRDYDNADRLHRVATVISDLNLDIWALSEVSVPAVDGLIKVLRDTFKQEFEAAYSEPGSSTGKQSTAIIWRPNVVECTREDWPEDLDALFRSHSKDDDLPFEAVHGKIFNRYPGLFRINLKSEEKDFDFYLVPLHLKAKKEGSLRREMASKALSYAVDQMIQIHGKDSDWIILGDVNASLKSGDFDALEEGGFTALGAVDENNGAFTYLKAPYKSLIDNIFVSDSMSRVANADDFYMIDTDRTVSRFVKETSDHRPIALRLSLADLPNTPARNGERLSVDEAFHQMLARAGLSPNSLRETLPVPSYSSSDPTSDWLVGRRNKTQFFQDNRTRFIDEITQANAQMSNLVGARLQPLTLTDVAVVYMAEAGLKGGIVDPDFVHSNGEVGLFPLPSRTSFWVGAHAPAHNQPMPLDVNIRTYLTYLCALRNKVVKTVSNIPLYPGLFREDGIAGHPDREAKLLAGIVHGYFWSGNYASRKVPFGHILAGYADDKPLDQIIASTDYVHAGKPLMTNRQSNIDEALFVLV